MTEIIEIVQHACNPGLILLAQVAVTATSEHSKYQGQKLASKAKEEHQRLQAAATLDSDASNVTDRQLRLAEYQEKSADDVASTVLKASTAAATGSLSAMETGAMGAGYDALMQDYQRQMGELSFMHTVNNKLAVNRYLREDDMRQSQVKSRLASIHTPIAQAQKGQALLNTAAGTLDAVGNYQSGGEGRNMESFKRDIGLG